MDLAAFLDSLDRLGADTAVWPVNLRLSADFLLTQSAAARQAMADMAEIEHMLRAASLTVAREGAGRGVDALAASAMRHPQVRPNILPLRPAVRAVFAAGAAVMLSLGLVIGWGANEPDEGPDHALAVAFEPVGSIDVD